MNTYLPKEVLDYIDCRISAQTVNQTKREANRMLREKFSNILTKYPSNNRRSASMAGRIIESATNGEVCLEADYDPHFDEEPNLKDNE